MVKWERSCTEGAFFFIRKQDFYFEILDIKEKRSKNTSMSSWSYSSTEFSYPPFYVYSPNKTTQSVSALLTNSQDGLQQQKTQNKTGDHAPKGFYSSPEEFEPTQKVGKSIRDSCLIGMIQRQRVKLNITIKTKVQQNKSVEMGTIKTMFKSSNQWDQWYISLDIINIIFLLTHEIGIHTVDWRNSNRQKCHPKTIV